MILTIVILVIILMIMTWTVSIPGCRSARAQPIFSFWSQAERVSPCGVHAMCYDMTCYVYC